MHRVVWAGLLLTVFALAIEVTVRIDDWAQHRVPLAARARSLADLMVRDSLGVHARSGARFRQFSINSLGFRGPEVTQAQLDSGTAVVVSGASESFGLYESKGKEWPRQLEDMLREYCPNPVHVLNAAFAGMSLPTVEQDVRLRISTVRPDWIVYYPTPMQYLEGTAPMAANPVRARDAAPPLWRPRALLRFRDAAKRAVPEPTLDLLRRISTQRSRKEASITPLAAAPKSAAEAFERDLRILVGTIRKSGAQPALVVHQNRFRKSRSATDSRLLRAWERYYPLYTGEAIISFDVEAAQRTAKVAADSGVLLIDPKTLLRGESDELFADFSHFTDLGAKIVAEAVATRLGPRCKLSPQ